MKTAKGYTCSFFLFDHRNQALNTQLKTYTKIPWVMTETQELQNRKQKKVNVNIPLKRDSTKSKQNHFCNDILIFNSILDTEKNHRIWASGFQCQFIYV